MYSDLGNLKKSEEFYLQALDIWNYNYGDNCIQSAATLNNLGLVYSDLGNLKKSEEFYLQALDIEN